MVSFLFMFFIGMTEGEEEKQQEQRYEYVDEEVTDAVDYGLSDSGNFSGNE